MLEFRELIVLENLITGKAHAMEVLNRLLLLLPSHIPGLSVLGNEEVLTLFLPNLESIADLFSAEMKQLFEIKTCRNWFHSGFPHAVTKGQVMVM
jgi:hypothetical protein